MVTRAYIQEKGNGRMEPEMRDLCDEFRDRGVPVELFTEKRLTRRQLPLAADTLVAGYVPAVLGALRQLDIAPPILDGYPRCLRHLLRRRIWDSTVGQIIHDLHEGIGQPVFAKPTGRMKRFTGSVFASPSDILFFEGASGRTPVFCSPVVRWLSEWRVFVVRGVVVGMRHYAGDPAINIDEGVVAEAVRTYQASGEAPAGYGIDFGVLESGETALMEVNDGFSLGSYGLDRAAYADLILARWCELTGI